MINKIIEFSIRNKFIIGIFILAWIGAGIWSMQQVPVDAIPDITDNQVQIITQAPNLGTEDIEQFITFPVELAMSNLPEVESIRSISRFGLSVVTVVFEESAGTYLPRQLVAEKLTEIGEEIPEGFGRPEMGPISTGLGEIYQFTLEVDPAYQDQYSLADLRTIQDWLISRQMALVPGVVEVNSFGGHIKEYEVAIKPENLNAAGVTVAEVFNALESNNQNTGGAYIEKNHQAYFIRGEGLAKNKTDIEQIVVKNQNGSPITIKDIAKVQEGTAIRYGALTENGKGESVGGMILMLKGANSKEVIAQVKQRMEQIESSMPEGVRIKSFIDRSKLIENTTGTIKTNLIEGGLIVIFILVLLLGNWRGGLIVASTIPLSLLFAFIMMNIFGVWANLMSLGAIDFGIIVDGAVIIVEATVFYLFVNRKKEGVNSLENRNQMALKAGREMMNPAFFGQLIIVIVFLPILALGGIEGKMFRPMALTFVFAMLGAMLLCLTYVPMISALFIKVPKKQKQSWGDRVVRKVELVYEKLLVKSLKKGKWIILSSVLALGLAIGVFSQMGGEFIPQLDEGDIAFHPILKPGTSLSETIETTTKIERIIKENFPEVKDIVSRMGVADVPTDPMPMELSDVIVTLKPQKEWTSAKTKEELVEKMKAAISIVPGVSYEFTQPIEMRFNELLTGVREDVAIKIFGDDLDVLSKKAQEVEQLIADIDGIGDMVVEATSGLPQINIHYKRHKIAQYGLDIQSINDLIQTAFAGKKAGVIFEGEKRFNMVLRLEEGNRKGIEDLENLFLPVANGQLVPLKEVAEISFQSGPMQISRENTNRRIYVGINIRNRDIKSVVQDIQNRLDANLELPTGYYIRYGGTFENYESAKKQLLTAVPIALGLIFLLIYFALKSLKETLIIYLAIPMAVIGGIFALWARGMPFSISAGVGFIVLFGVAVLNGLVLLNGLSELKGGGITNLNERIIKGSIRRVRPIMLTALTDTFGFLPMAISTSSGAEVQRPLATVVIGGLITSTFLTLFLLPILYRWIEKGKSFNLPLRPNYAVIFGIVLLAGVSLQAQEQSPFSSTLEMEEAVQLAKDNFYLLKNKELEIERQKRTVVWDWGETEVFTGGEEIKQGQGIYTLFGVGQQNIDLLSIGAKKKLRETGIETAVLEKEVAELQLEKEVREAWIATYTAAKEYELYQRLDSIYSRYLQAAALNYEVEEISELAYNKAKKEALEIRLKKNQSLDDYQMQRNTLNLWLDAEDTYDVSTAPPVMDISVTSYKMPEDHPTLLATEHRLKELELQHKLTKSKQLPKLNVEYGFQRVEGENGYFSYQAGISIPFLSGTLKNEKRMQQYARKSAAQKADYQKKAFDQSYRQALLRFNKWNNSYDFYQKEALPLAHQQQKGALLAYREGTIDQTTFSQILSQTVQTELDAIQSLERYLETLTALHYYQTY